MGLLGVVACLADKIADRFKSDMVHQFSSLENSFIINSDINSKLLCYSQNSLTGAARRRTLLTKERLLVRVQIPWQNIKMSSKKIFFDFLQKI